MMKTWPENLYCTPFTHWIRQIQSENNEDLSPCLFVPGGCGCEILGLWENHISELCWEGC